MSGLAAKLREAAGSEGPSTSLANLPSPDFPLVGRKWELTAAQEKFLSKVDGRRLLIFGQPGIGTTRFALELAGWARSVKNYDFAIWINCQQFHIYGGRRFSSPQHTASLNDIIKEIAHFTKAEAALKATGREAIVALNSRCAEKSVLLVVDSLQGEVSKEIESFIYAQPSNFDIIATARHHLGWRSSVELRPWESGASDAEAFLTKVDADLGWGLTEVKQRVALNAGLGVPSGIIWSGRLLTEGYPEEVVENLSHEGWGTLLQHFFAQQYETDIKTQSAKRAAALLCLSGGLDESTFNEVVGSHASDGITTSRLLVNAGFATTGGGQLLPVPFASPFLRKRMSGSRKINSTIIRDWIVSLNKRLSQRPAVATWGARFIEIDPLFHEAIAAIDAYSIHGQEAAGEFIELFEALSYFLYARAYWDEFERYQSLFLESCLKVKKIYPIIEVCLVWGARIIRQRHTIFDSDGFISTTVEMMGVAHDISPATRLRIQVAQLGFRSPNNFGVNLAQDLGLLAKSLENLNDLEWACRATLHSGNVWAETQNFDQAETAYQEISRICNCATNSGDILWRAEMLALSGSSRGVLANRRGEFPLAASLLAGSVAELVQASDRATALGELALAYSKIGRRREGRAGLNECLVLRKLIGATETVMESHPGWEVHDGFKELFSRKGLELFNPWWR